MEYTHTGQVKGEKRPLSGIPCSAKQEASLDLQRTQMGEGDEGEEEEDASEVGEVGEGTEGEATTVHRTDTGADSTQTQADASASSIAATTQGDAEEAHRSDGEVDE